MTVGPLSLEQCPYKPIECESTPVEAGIRKPGKTINFYKRTRRDTAILRSWKFVAPEKLIISGKVNELNLAGTKEDFIGIFN